MAGNCKIQRWSSF